MKILSRIPPGLLAIAALSGNCLAQDQAAPATAGTTTIYRQILPDGRILYTDKLVKGAKVDEKIAVEPPISGNLWTSEPGNHPLPPQSQAVPVRSVNVVPPPGHRRTFEDASADVVRAEMLLEDAKKRLQADEAAASADEQQRKRLQHDVSQAEAALRNAVAEREQLRHASR